MPELPLIRPAARPPKPIALKHEEQQLLDQICFVPNRNTMTAEQLDSVIDTACKNTHELFTLLNVRRAIPRARWVYFHSEDHNPNKLGLSRCDAMAQQGLPPSKLTRHPRFVPILRYFIYGPDLPHLTMAEFCQIVNTEGRPWCGDLVNAFVADEAQRLAGVDDLPEEFYKLALECDLAAWQCKEARSAVFRAMRARRVPK